MITREANRRRAVADSNLATQDLAVFQEPTPRSRFDADPDSTGELEPFFDFVGIARQAQGFPKGQHVAVSWIDHGLNAKPLIHQMFRNGGVVLFTETDQHHAV